MAAKAASSAMGALAGIDPDNARRGEDDFEAVAQQLAAQFGKAADQMDAVAALGHVRLGAALKIAIAEIAEVFRGMPGASGFPNAVPKRKQAGCEWNFKEEERGGERDDGGECDQASWSICRAGRGTELLQPSPLRLAKPSATAMAVGVKTPSARSNRSNSTPGRAEGCSSAAESSGDEGAAGARPSAWTKTAPRMTSCHRRLPANRPIMFGDGVVVTQEFSRAGERTRGRVRWRPNPRATRAFERLHPRPRAAASRDHGRLLRLRGHGRFQAIACGGVGARENPRSRANSRQSSAATGCRCR